MNIRVITAIAAAALATSAYAADPVGVVSTPGISFGEYTGSMPVGVGQVETDELFYIDEQTGPLGKSWYIFFDPQGGKTVNATITFDAPITGVFSTKTDLDASNATYGATGITYGTSRYIGLESPTDWFAYTPGSNQMTIHFTALDPGDDIRVFTSPVPEPGTYALMAAGLAAFGALKLRRSRKG
ncbi:MAG: PEP-CTERM sorting domain-containing protein [Proteobacteria bacterium]|nr:PEP-CTERM sorting domain-containing protein [Pseudomonadota bacterium]